MSIVDRARFAHWTDLNEMNHIGVNSDALWRELEVLEAAETVGPRMPNIGDIVKVKYGAMVVEGEVTRIDGTRFLMDRFSRWTCFTIENLIVAVDEEDSATQ